MDDATTGAPARTGAPTLETVAALAGVSRATASRVVNADARVAPQLRAAVEDAVARLGFVPNRAARALVTRRTDSVALLLREPVELGVVDPYLSSMVIALTHALLPTGRQPVVLMAPAGQSGSRTADYVRSHVDGVLLLSVHDGDPLPAELVRSGVPLVSLGRIPGAPAGIGVVDADNAGGARLATEQLLGAGRRRVATIAGPADMSAAVDRLAGFEAALREASRPVDLVASGDFTAASGERAMGELLHRAPDLDAVFAANDAMALGALRALRAAGRGVPDDVAVVGFDDVPLAEHASPPLTTVRQPVADLARTMVALLAERLGGDASGTEVLLPTELVVRASG